MTVNLSNEIVDVFICLYASLSVCRSFSMSACFYLTVSMSVFLYVSICVSLCMSVCLSVGLSVFLSQYLLEKREAGGDNDRGVNLSIQRRSHHLQKPGLFSHFPSALTRVDLISNADHVNIHRFMITFYATCHLTCPLCLSGSSHSLQEHISLQ